MSSIVNIFIPRILASVSSNHIKKTFLDHNIGNIVDISFRHRQNEKKHHYSFAFLQLELFDTDIAKNIWNKIEDAGSMRLFYDFPNYWELKHYVPREDRTPSPKNSQTFTPLYNENNLWCKEKTEEDIENNHIENLCNELIYSHLWREPLLYPSVFTVDDNLSLNIEFNALEKEIWAFQ